MTFTTEIFSLQSGVYSRRILHRLLYRYLWIPAFPVVVFLILGAVSNDAWWWVALIYVFLVMPMLLFLAYFNATLTREAVQSIKPHSLSMDHNGLRVEFYKVAENVETPVRVYPKFKLYNRDDMVLSGEPKLFIPRADIASVDVEGRMIVIRLKNDSRSFYLVPLDVIGSKDAQSLRWNSEEL